MQALEKNFSSALPEFLSPLFLPLVKSKAEFSQLRLERRKVLDPGRDHCESKTFAGFGQSCTESQPTFRSSSETQRGYATASGGPARSLVTSVR